MTEAIIHFIIAVPFLIFAIVLSRGKGAFLIAGYNTLPDEEKEKYDEEKLTKFIGAGMYGIFGVLILWGLNGFLDKQWIFVTGLILLITITLVMIVTVTFDPGNRFKKK